MCARAKRGVGVGGGVIQQNISILSLCCILLSFILSHRYRQTEIGSVFNIGSGMKAARFDNRVVRPRFFTGGAAWLSALRLDGQEQNKNKEKCSD